ncbi:MAG TPA: competence/damage-inducible protein A [Paludibacteraceae bacterium]|nr:competence/damage-inducible protein A [Paludibacteraceae bacterium]HPS09759.1 competence/damage-inducible protein A [Paludibacteraceae bacterium]
MIEIITIGDEILIGQIVDTNSAWMAVELNKAGFQLAQITSVHDEADHIKKALDEALLRADVVLMTGGLGPTKDDITKQTLCEYFGTKLVFNPEVLENIQQIYHTRQSVMNELTKSQAMVPEKCTVIQNRAGSAPITWFEKEGKVIVSMPGVPLEMKKVMSEEIIPRLQKHFKTPAIIHKTVQVYGIPESQLALRLTEWENSLPEYLHLAYLPNFGIVKLRISGAGQDKYKLEEAINQQVETLKSILGESIFAYEDKPVEKIIYEKLKSSGLTVSTAESCTGGNIAHRLTLIPGISDCFKGTVVAYHNELKINMLGVSAQDIEQYGAVSSQVATQMAEGARKVMQTDLAVATTGIAGPTGGTYEKPVGTIWISVSSPERTITRSFNFGQFARENFIERSTMAALMMLNEMI